MAEQRTGRQTPTKSLILPYSETKGEEAVRLYNSTGRTVMEWQELLAYDMLALNESGLWTHSKFGYSVPRRNGKSEIVIARALYGLRNGERILYTAHRTSTSHSIWERMVDALANTGLMEGEDYKTTKQFGFETIKMADGGVMNFRTRSSKGGLGEGYDLLIIDEAQEYTEDQESALKYVVTDSKNPQTVFCGTPPTPVSSGTVFSKLREKALSGNSENTGWAEWSVDFIQETTKRDLWYETNPSLGIVFTERAVADEIGTDDVDFNIQRLGLWIRYNLKSAISKTEWEEHAVAALPKLQKTAYAGIKFGADGANVALSVAVKTLDHHIFVESIDCRPVRAGYAWILEYLKGINAEKVAIDGANGQKILFDAMRENKLRGALLPKVAEVVKANATFEQGLFDGTLLHMNQPSLAQAAENCEKRAIGTNGGFGYRALKEGIEIALLDSAILAFWLCKESRERRKQRVSY